MGDAVALKYITRKKECADLHYELKAQIIKTALLKLKVRAAGIIKIKEGGFLGSSGLGPVFSKQIGRGSGKKGRTAKNAEAPEKSKKARCRGGN